MPDKIILGDSLRSDTTIEEDRHTASQRKVNLIWESTQSLIATSIVIANIVAAFRLPTENVILGNAFFLVIGFYFGRTNHQKVGGVTLGR